MMTYRKAAGVKWAVGRFDITLTNHAGAARRLRYPQAAIWDLASRGYAFDRIVSMMTHIASIDADAADVVVRQSLDDLAESGFLERG